MYVEMSVQNYIMNVCLIDYYDIHTDNKECVHVF